MCAVVVLHSPNGLTSRPVDRGYCDRTTGECECIPGWLGPACTCSVRNCDHGKCNATSGQCVCAKDYYGPACDICTMGFLMRQSI